jgi:hypothetical protein
VHLTIVPQEKFGLSHLDDSWNLHQHKKRKASGSRRSSAVASSLVETEMEPQTPKSEKKRIKRTATPVVSLTTASMKDVIKAIQSSEFSEPFLNPVTEDIAPGYFDVVSSPMDINTIKKRLRTGVYDDRSEDFIQDFNLIWDNCCLYNEPSAEIVSWAKSLSELFDGLLRQYSIVEEPIQPKKKVAQESKSADKVEKPVKAETSHVNKQPLSKMAVEAADHLDLKSCTELIQRLKSHPFIDPFLDPVDPKLAPGYSDIISTPMDVSQVEKKLKKATYGGNWQLFIDDIRLIWKNCMTYNDPDSQIYKWASDCETYFEKELQKMVVELKKDQHQMETIRSNVGMEIIGKKTPSSSSGAAKSAEPTTTEKKERAPKRPSVEEHDVARKKMVETKTESEKKPSPVKIPDVIPVIQKPVVSIDTHAETASFNSASHLEIVNKRIKELRAAVALLKMGDSANCNAVSVREHCHKKATEKFKDLKNGLVVCPGVLEVLKFGEIDQSMLSCDENSLFPVNFSSLRSMRIRLLPDNTSSADDGAVTPFIPINLKSVVAHTQDKSSVIFRVVMENGVIVSEAYTPLQAWENVIGKETQTFHSIGSKLRRCRAVFNRVCASPDSVPFLEKSSLDEAEGYYKVIQAPMWLREIHNRLVDGVYDNEYDFAWDMRLIIRNCKTYNLPKSSLYASADRMSLLFESLFLNWVINIQDRSVEDVAKGDWDDWTYLKYFDGNPNENFCVLTKTKAKQNELMQCAWCEDQYLPSALKLPSSKLGLKTWGCPRCRRAMELGENDMSGNPFANLTVDLPYCCGEFGGNIFIAAPDIGTGWNQARRKYRNKNIFLSPLGYEVYSIEDVNLQKDFESTIDHDLVNARAKEFKELCGDKKSSNEKQVTRRKGRKVKRKVNVDADEEDSNANASTSSPIDAKFLEEEGRIVTGKLVDFKVPIGYHLSWCVNTNESSLMEKHKSATPEWENLLDWKQELALDELPPYGYFGFHHDDIRSRIEALPNAQLCLGYRFRQAGTVANELLSDYSRTLHDYENISQSQDRFQKLLLEERWKYEKSRTFPSRVASTQPENGSTDEEFSLKCSQLGFKMVVSKMFPAGGLDILLSVWDLLDSIKHLIGFNYFTLVDLISSVNPPSSLLTTPSQIVFDEVCCILTEQLLFECRNRCHIESESEWQSILMMHPLNIMTWSKILEKCLLVIGLPLSPEDAKLLMESSIQGECAVFLKVLCLLFNHPYVECVLDFSNGSGQKLGSLVRSIVDNITGMATTKMENEAFCTSLLDLFVSDDNVEDVSDEKRKMLCGWMKALFGRIGFNVENADSGVDVSICDDNLPQNRRSWGSFILSCQPEHNTQFLLPHCFATRSTTECAKKLKSLTCLERALSLLSCTDSEGLCSQDRLSIYLLLVDHIYVCRNTTDLLEKNERKLQDKFKAASIDARVVQTTESPLISPPQLPKTAKCYFTGIPYELVNDCSAWVVVPKSLMDEKVVEIDTSSNVSAVLEKPSAGLQQEKRPKRGEYITDGHSFALKSAVLQLLGCKNMAQVELAAYEVCRSISFEI